MLFISIATYLDNAIICLDTESNTPKKTAFEAFLGPWVAVFPFIRILVSASIFHLSSRNFQVFHI